MGLDDGINSPASLDNPLSLFCVLYGTHRNFTAAQLASLYYSNSDYRQQVRDVVRRLVGQHFVLPEDGQVLIDQARHRRPV